MSNSTKTRAARIGKTAAAVMLAVLSVASLTGATEVAGTTTSYGYLGTPKLLAQCYPDPSSQSIQVGVMVDQRQTGPAKVRFRAWYNAWSWNGSAWVHQGAAWINGGQITNGYTSLLGEYTLALPQRVSPYFTYTMSAEIWLVNGATGQSIAHRYYTASPGEYRHNGSVVSGTGCSPRW
jgi:hypothetical protein